jgi:hypothetical protein
MDWLLDPVHPPTIAHVEPTRIASRKTPRLSGRNGSAVGSAFRPGAAIEVRKAFRVRVANDRAIGVICLAGIAVTHLIDLPAKIQEAPYMAVLFCGLIVASAGLGIALAIGRRPAILWPLAGAIALPPLIGYVLSRSVGLPELEDHVGDWLTPAGVASLVFETVLVAISARHLARRRAGHRERRAAAGPGRSMPARDR